MVRKIIGAFLTLIFVIAIVGVGFGIFLNAAPAATESELKEKVSLTVEKGETLETIANHLEEKALIKSSFFMRVYSKLTGTEQSIQQGSYEIPRGLSTVQVHDLLVSGKQVLVKVTVPEGFTVRMIGNLLEEKGIVGAKDFLKATNDPKLLKELDIKTASAQGFLFPDTYLFSREMPADAVVRHMVGTFKQRLDEAVPGWRSLTEKDLREKVILASIVEREYVAPSEAPLMASVFYNRLRIGKALESCATVVYVMTEEYGMPHPSRLFFRDLDIKSKYNTYRNAGLPPGAISNPGLIALKAAFQPASSDYLYFVLKGPEATQHHFSKTFAEHNQASVFYLKG